jgi:hypothetical protein
MRAACRFGCSLLALGWLLLACSHDLDKLTAKNGAVQDSGSGGKGGSGGKAGKGGSSGGGDQSDGGGGTGPDVPDAGPTCSPCDALTTTAKDLGLRECCRGATGDECGLTFADGTLCLPRMVPGQPNTTCPELRANATTRLDGCCRPDGRCGVSADGLGLGCVAREELGVALGGSMAQVAVSCEYTCAVDEDCDAVLPGYVCGESPDHSQRLCLKGCKRDQDCPRGDICGLSNDQAMDRVLAVCRQPIGEVEPGSFCSAAKDCIHGVCTKIPDGEPFCSKLCANVGDCGVDFNRCSMSGIPTPSGGASDKFSICLQ